MVTLMDHSHAINTTKPSSNHRELAETASATRLIHQPLQSTTLPSSPHREASSLQRRIPQGQIFAEIPVEACKAYPIRTWQGTGLEPRIAYADFNTHQERNTLSVKLLPLGGKTAPHPQIVFFINGPYHVENLGYTRSNPWRWTTWMEFHLDARELKKITDALIRTELAVEALQ